MGGINKVILVGNVGSDVEFRSLATGTNLAKFSLATNERGRKDQDGQPQTEWHNIVAWGKLAEFCSQYVTKGQQLYIEGRIRTRTYEKDGIKRWFTEINAYTIELLGRKSDQGSQPGAAAGFPNDGDDVPF